ncbi:SRPBCC family protein [Aurantibacillus circumpalustris]|uniref:SRPBCC family protein n=1 Tax=Aurantibacillus circumpalustris TaxID=3036359 RepID=UPI00295A7AEB|nr:SRPBCC domain-containing protein [Aurantibacillus circumpalustris]
MKTTQVDFTTSILVDQTPKEVFNAILNVRVWWQGLHNEKIEGKTSELNGEFTYHAGEGAHYSKQKLVELIPNKKVVWLVTESKLNFLKEQDEWTGTEISFEISKAGVKTKIRFTHIGLVPKIECYEVCSAVWNQYIQQRLLASIKAKN